MSQPKWQLVAQIGDANPLDYGGYYVFRDATGVYTEEAEYLEVPLEYLDEEDEGDDEYVWTVYRFPLERCTYLNGVLSANRYHPDHPEWFADDIPGIASSTGLRPTALRDWFCSENPLERAWAYEAVGNYCGFENLDQYPLVFHKREDVEAYFNERTERCDEHASS